MRLVGEMKGVSVGRQKLWFATALSMTLICAGKSDSLGIDERAARIDKTNLDVRYDGLVYIEDSGSECRYSIPELRIEGLKWTDLGRVLINRDRSEIAG